MAGSGGGSVTGDPGLAQALYHQDDGALRSLVSAQRQGRCSGFGRQRFTSGFTLPDIGVKEVIEASGSD